MKNKIIIIVFLILISLFLKILYNKNINNINKTEFMTRHVKNIGYTKSNVVYSKLISDRDFEKFREDLSFGFNSIYEELFYEVETNTFIKKKNEKLGSNLISLYIASDYEGKITYSYSLENSGLKLYFEGAYPKFTCIPAENYNQETIQSYCSIIKKELLVFNKNLNEFTNNKKISDIKKGVL